MTPEARARQTIDALLTAAGWHVCNVASANLHAGGGAVKGIAIREFPLNPGHGFADYLLYVNYDVYRIKTEVTEAGARVDKGYWLETQDKATRRKTAWQLDEDFEYDPTELDRAVQTPDRIRTMVRTLRDKWNVDLFPHRQELPKTLVFAKDDNHAEKIVELLREEFGRGNEFVQKITYRTTGASPEQLIKDYRTAYYPRVAVTVDMIATGTDIKPVEIVMFMRSVKSRSFFEQMKGRGVRVCNGGKLRELYWGFCTTVSRSSLSADIRRMGNFLKVTA